MATRQMAQTKYRTRPRSGRRKLVLSGQQEETAFVVPDNDFACGIDVLMAQAEGIVFPPRRESPLQAATSTITTSITAARPVPSGRRRKRPILCFDRCGREADGCSAYCAECSAAHLRRKGPQPRGLAESRCSSCGEMFLNVTAWEHHYTLDDNDEQMVCHDPSARGLLQDVRGVWGTPQGHARLAADAARMSAMRRARREAALPPPTGSK